MIFPLSIKIPSETIGEYELPSSSLAINNLSFIFMLPLSTLYFKKHINLDNVIGFFFIAILKPSVNVSVIVFGFSASLFNGNDSYKMRARAQNPLY